MKGEKGGVFRGAVGLSLVLPLLVGLLYTLPVIAETPEYGGTLVFALSDNPTDFDPHIESGANGQAVKVAVYDGLVNFNPDGTIKPELAASWELVNDVTYDFHLADASWHNGDPVTSDDVVYSFERMMDPATGAWLYGDLQLVEAVESVDPKTVRIRLQEPFAPFLQLLAMPQALILSKDWMEGGTNVGTEMMGCGAFEFVGQEANRIVLKKNDHYYKPGLPYLDGIEFVPIVDGSARVAALETGQVNFAGFIAWSTWDQLDANPDVTLTKGLDGFMLSFFNVNVEPLNDPRVRRALRYAIDPTPIIQTIFFGQAEPATGGWIPQGSFYYNADLADYFSYDPDKARDLLAAAGYPNGFEIEVLSTSTYDMHFNTATIIQQQWAEIGVTANLDLIEFGSARERERRGDYQIYMMGGNTLPYPDPHSFGIYFSKDSAAYAANVGFSDAVLEELLALGRTTFDPDCRKAIYHAYERRLLELSPLIWYVHRTNAWAHASNVKGFEFLAEGTQLWNDLAGLDYVWIDD